MNATKKKGLQGCAGAFWGGYARGRREGRRAKCRVRRTPVKHSLAGEIMRSADALVSLLQQSGVSRKVVTWIVGSLRACPYPGGHPDDVAGALFRWRNSGVIDGILQNHSMSSVRVGHSGDNSVPWPDFKESEAEEPSQLKLFA